MVRFPCGECKPVVFSRGRSTLVHVVCLCLAVPDTLWSCSRACCGLGCCEQPRGGVRIPGTRSMTFPTWASVSLLCNLEANQMAVTRATTGPCLSVTIALSLHIPSVHLSKGKPVWPFSPSLLVPLRPSVTVTSSLF